MAAVKVGLAMGDFNEAIRLDPERAAPYNNRGNLLSRFGRYELAIRDFSRAVVFAAIGLFTSADRDERAATFVGADRLEVGVRLQSLRLGAGIHQTRPRRPDTPD